MRWLLLSILLLFMNVASAESRYALLIANQNYPTPQKDLNIFGALETPVSEMRELSKVLQNYDFTVTEVKDADLDEMSSAINRFVGKLQPGDVGLLYYAGHGVQVDGNNYLIPINKKFADKADVRNEAYLAQKAIDKLSGSSARVKLVFLDSCRNQLLLKEKGRGFSDPGFAKMDAKGIVISYATGLGEIAADNITYTSQLVKAIQSRANQPIEVVLSGAQELTAQATGGQQIPWYEKRMVGEFCFGTCGKPEPAKQEDNSAELERLRKENEQLRKAGILPPEVTPPPKSGQSFQDKLKDGSFGPEMVQIPAGTFQMGSNEYDKEKPVHTVTMKSFAMGKYEVTFEEYDKFCEATGRSKPDDEGWGRGKRPVINVSWDSAKDYAKWLSEQTEKDYRLPSEAQWEYACRAGTTTKYWWGNEIGKNNANCDGCGSQWDNKRTAPAGSFKPNPFGLYDVHGNVWEWLEDEWHDSYSGAPSDGSAWVERDSYKHTLRGGSWLGNDINLRCAIRYSYTTGNMFNNGGFRLIIESESEDKDRDGVPDYRDKCPNNTPLVISKGVDSDGCPLDSDGDVVPDYRDLCPGTPSGAKVDENGCEYVTKGCDFILSSDVTFGFNKFNLTPQGQDRSAALAARIMSALPSIDSIVVIGHTDSMETDAHQTLSEKRAYSVAQFLVNKGIPTAKFFMEGHGKSEPVSDNTTKEGRAKNRRVQISIGQGKDCPGVKQE